MDERKRKLKEVVVAVNRAVARCGKSRSANDHCRPRRAFRGRVRQAIERDGDGPVAVFAELLEVAGPSRACSIVSDP
jgi:hypothetical protein